jgi:hypothetical protein
LPALAGSETSNLDMAPAAAEPRVELAMAADSPDEADAAAAAIAVRSSSSRILLRATETDATVTRGIYEIICGVCTYTNRIPGPPLMALVRRHAATLRRLRLPNWVSALDRVGGRVTQQQQNAAADDDDCACAIGLCLRLQVLENPSAVTPFRFWGHLQFLHTVRNVVVGQPFTTLTFRALADALPRLRVLEVSVSHTDVALDGFAELAARLNSLTVAGAWPVESMHQNEHQHQEIRAAQGLPDLHCIRWCTSTGRDPFARALIPVRPITLELRHGDLNTLLAFNPMALSRTTDLTLTTVTSERELITFLQAAPLVRAVRIDVGSFRVPPFVAPDVCVELFDGFRHAALRELHVATWEPNRRTLPRADYAVRLRQLFFPRLRWVAFGGGGGAVYMAVPESA